MLKPLTLGAALAAFIVSSPVPGLVSSAAAQQACEVRSKLVERLAAKYKETSVAMGLASNGKLVEVLTDNDGNTWTIIVTTPEGMSCLVATGESWRKFDARLQEPQA